MKKQTFTTMYRLGFGLLTLAAMGVQYHKEAQKITFSAANFFSFFTIESNILAAAVFIIAAFVACAGKRETSQMAIVRGAATLYMTITGIVYVTLLSGSEVALQTTLAWVNFVLHYLMPVVVLGDWLFNVSAVRITMKRAVVWLIFPIAYLVYSLVRGTRVNWYPYPFLDPRTHGYGRVAVMSMVVAVVAILLAWALSGYTLWRVPAVAKVGKTKRR